MGKYNFITLPKEYRGETGGIVDAHDLNAISWELIVLVPNAILKVWTIEEEGKDRVYNTCLLVASIKDTCIDISNHVNYGFEYPEVA